MVEDTDNHARDAGQSGLLALKTLLCGLPDRKRRQFPLSAERLACAYREQILSAPRRTKPFLSHARNGLAPVDAGGRRKEERLAMAWFNRGLLRLADGEAITLLDYQFPLKSRQRDEGIGKIDLLGVNKGALAVIELKVAGNREDRRIALLEGLIYAAIVEANAEAISREIERTKGHRIEQARPHIYLVAPREFWSVGYPPLGDIQSLAARTAEAIETQIGLFSFEDAGGADLGLAGTRPIAPGDVMLFPVGT